MDQTQLDSQASSSSQETPANTSTAPETANTAPETTQAGGGTPETPAYQPNFKYKVLDKEQEIDEFIRPVVKDVETEKKIRELYEKAHGIDFVKTERQKIREEYNTYKTQTEPVIQAAQQISKFLQKGDFDRLFDGLGISDEQLFQIAQKKIEMRKLSPEQQAIYNKARETEIALEQKEATVSQYEQQLNQVMVQQRTFELQSELSKPEVSAIAQAFDARVGKPGAFREEVVARGQYHWLTSKKDISASDAVQEVLKIVGGTGPTQATISQDEPQVAGQVGTSAQSKPVIPNIAGKGTSPVKRVPKSLDDIRAMAKEL